eukprot:17329-Heterococcus_DN1.PRE.1
MLSVTDAIAKDGRRIGVSARLTLRLRFDTPQQLPCNSGCVALRCVTVRRVNTAYHCQQGQRACTDACVHAMVLTKLAEQ